MMFLRYTLLLSLLLVLSAYSTDPSAAAEDAGPDDKTTCSIEWDKEDGLILHHRKIILENVGELLFLQLTQDNAYIDRVSSTCS